MNKQFINKMKEYFKDIPQEMIDQEEGLYEKDCPSCFGAHIAHMMLEDEEDFTKGKTIFFKEIGLNQAVAIAMLNKAGVGHNRPFDTGTWKKHPHEVLENLLKMDKPKSLKGVDLSGADLEDADLKDADLREAKFGRADFCEANLSGADLSYADLSRANLDFANLGFANLTGADLTDANLECTNLIGTNLNGADLTDANLIDVNLEDALLKGSKGIISI